MPPYILQQVLALHPYQQLRFSELLAWAHGGTEQGCPPSIAAYEKAIEWAKQVEIPPTPVEEKTE